MGSYMKTSSSLPSEPSENSTVEVIRSHKKPLTVKQLAEITAMSPESIYKMASANPPRIPRMRLGGKILFDPKQTAKWLEERCA